MFVILLIFALVHSQPLYESDGVSYWKLLSPLQPIQGYKYGTIQLRTKMFLSLTFIYYGYDVNTETDQWLNVLRIGTYGNAFNCDEHGSRYPAFFTYNNEFHSTLSSKITCWGNAQAQGIMLLPEYKEMTINTTYSVEMRYDTKTCYLTLSNNDNTMHHTIYNGSYETLNTSLNSNLSVIISDTDVGPAHITILDLLIISYDDQFTLYPTGTPTNKPTQASTNPTSTPSNNPILAPSNNPTLTPTKISTSVPTTNPTSTPSNNPTSTPSNNPTLAPTNPSFVFTTNPTQTPTSASTNNPTFTPTNYHDPVSTVHDEKRAVFFNDNDMSLIVIILCSLFLLIIICCILWCYIYRRKKKYASNTKQINIVVSSTKSTSFPLSTMPTTKKVENFMNHAIDDVVSNEVNHTIEGSEGEKPDNLRNEGDEFEVFGEDKIGGYETFGAPNNNAQAMNGVLSVNPANDEIVIGDDDDFYMETSGK